jgi:hypothetical protein
MYHHSPRFVRRHFLTPSIVAIPSSDVAEPAPEPLSAPSESTFLASVSLPLSPAITTLSTGTCPSPSTQLGLLPLRHRLHTRLRPQVLSTSTKSRPRPPLFLPLILFVPLTPTIPNPFSLSAQQSPGLTQVDSVSVPIEDMSVLASPLLSPTTQQSPPEVTLQGVLLTPAPSANALPTPSALLSAHPDHSIAPPSSPSLSESISQLYKSYELESTPTFSVDLVLLSPSKLPAESCKTIPIFPTPFEVEIIPIPVHSSLLPAPQGQLEVTLDSVSVPLEATLSGTLQRGSTVVPALPVTPSIPPG